jgi:hypothetical protein
MVAPEVIYSIAGKKDLAEAGRQSRFVFDEKTERLLFRRDDGTWIVVSGKGPQGEPGESIKGDPGEPGPEREVRIVEKQTKVPVVGPKGDKGDPGEPSKIPGPRGLPGERGARGPSGVTIPPKELVRQYESLRETVELLINRLEALEQATAPPADTPEPKGKPSRVLRDRLPASQRRERHALEGK